uniref:Dabb family protein n=1 Tax=Yoonia sp. TaxID=2212373 RepID=UPI004047B289
MTPRPGIRHIVFFSAKDKANIPKIVAGLQELGKIPHSDVFEVRENTKGDAWSGEVDVIVYAEFANNDALAAYKADPIYAHAITVVKPLRDLRIAADF